MTAGQQWMLSGSGSLNLGCLMETKLNGLSRRYQTALRKHLEQGARASPPSADRFGRQALAIGLETLDLAKIHEQALTALMSSNSSRRTRNGVIKRAQAFFIKAVIPIERTHRPAMEASRPPERTGPGVAPAQRRAGVLESATEKWLIRFLRTSLAFDPLLCQAGMMWQGPEDGRVCL